MVPFYLVDTDNMTSDGPFSTAASLKDEIESREDQDCIVASIADDGTMRVQEVEDWLENNDED